MSQGFVIKPIIIKKFNLSQLWKIKLPIGFVISQDYFEKNKFINTFHLKIKGIYIIEL